MIKYVPEYIFEKYEQGVYRGNFTGYALFFDIKDFTRITEAVTFKGQKGAEVINRILTEAFTPVIDAIESQGGFVTGFAGDAFMAVFAGVGKSQIMTVFEVIRTSLAAAPRIKETNGKYKIDARLAVSYGEICWRILKNEWQNEYYFYGKAIEDCNSFADLKRDVVFSRGAAREIGLENFREDNAGVYVPLPGKFELSKAKPRSYRYGEDTVKSFLNDNLCCYKAENEIRDISNAFIYLEKIGEEDLSQVIAQIEEMAYKFHAFFNKLDYSDKGLLGIMIFGAPRKYEKTLDRMMYFVSFITSYVKEIKIGISSGRVYAGFTGTASCQEYTIIGYPPNLASRLMMKADMGEILVDIFSYEQLVNRYNFSPLGKIGMKGFAEEIPVYKYSCEKQRIEETGLSKYCGREKELAQLSEILDREEEFREVQVLYVHGEPGMGKSRLVKEVRETMRLERGEWCQLMCDGILKQPYVPVIKYLKSYFGYEESGELEENRRKFEEKWDKLAAADEELQRVKSIVGQLLGFRWRESIWELLPAAAKPLQERMALVSFFEKLSEEYLVIQIEDGQWIETETLELMRALIKSGGRGLRIVICCRYEGDGSLINYGLSEGKETDIELQKLGLSESEDLVKHILELEELSGSARELILSKGQGNPLFLEQISLYLKEQGYVDKRGNLTKDVENVAAFGITDIIGARIDNLTDDIRTLVYYASVLGVEFDIQILSTMLDHKLDSEADEVVNNCIWVKLKELHYLFAQILFRDTAYNRLLNEKQQQLNLLAAESYQKLYTKEELKPYYEMVGLHYERAGKKKKTFAAYSAAFFVAYRDMRLAKALDLAERSLGIKLETLEPDSIPVGQGYNCLGLVYYAMGEYQKSLEYSLQALPIFEMNDVKYTLIIAVLNNAGNAYSMLGDYEKALEYHGKSLLLRSINLGEDHPDYALSVMHMGNDYLHMGRNDEALEHYERALVILKQHEKDQPGKLVSGYNNLGAFYLQTKNYATALESLLNALEILAENDSLDKPRAAPLYRQIGNAYDGLERNEEALENLGKALEIEEKIYGKEHPQTATTYDYLGRVYKKTKEKEKALEYLNKALDIYLKYYGREHPAPMHLYYNLGDCYYQMNKLDKAMEYLEMSLDIHEKSSFASEFKDDVLELIKEIKSERK